MLKLMLVKGKTEDESSAATNGTAPDGYYNHGKISQIISRPLGSKRRESCIN